MRKTLNKFWTALYIACLHFPAAAVVSGLVGARAGGLFWFMGIAAHHAVRSARNLPFQRQFAIWLMAMTVGFSAAIGIAVGIAAMLGTVEGIRTLIDLSSLVTSGQVPIAFVFGLESVTILPPVLLARSVAHILLRRSSRPPQVISPPLATRSSTHDGKGIPGRPTRSSERQGASPTTYKMVREASWFVGCVAVVGVLVGIIMTTASPNSPDKNGLPPSVFAIGVLVLFGLVTAVRMERLGASSTTYKMVREASWFVGCIAIVGVLAAIAAALDGKRNLAPASEYAVGVLGLFGVVTTVRLVVWLIRGGGRWFRYWPEIVLTTGVCLFVYGGSGVIDADRAEDSDRYLATIGGGLAIGGALLRRHSIPNRGILNTRSPESERVR